MIGQVTLAKQIEGGVAKTEGDMSAFDKLRSVLVQFDPYFEILPGTKAGEKPKMNPFQQSDPAITGE